MTASRPAALVTGSASGIGAAAAIGLARAGYDVAVNYSRSEDRAKETAALCEAEGAKTIVVGCDVGGNNCLGKMD